MPRRESVVSFGSYLYDLELGQLSLNGQKIRIPDQNSRLLTFLIQKSGRLATREELRAALWPSGAPYDAEQAINKAVSQLRTALRDNPAAPQYIETIPQRGYRFCAPVSLLQPVSHSVHNAVVPANPPDIGSPLSAGSSAAALPVAIGLPATSPQTSAAQNLPADAPRARVMRRVLLAAALAAVALVLVALGYRFYHERMLSHAILSVGVAPFDYTSPQAEQLATSLRFELIDGLAASPQTRVIAATSTRSLKSGPGLPAEAAKLGLDVVVFGYMEIANGTFHLRLEIVRPSDQAHIATLTYSGVPSELVETQTRVLQDVFHVLELKRSGRSSIGRTANTEAYDAYLHGVYGYFKYTPDDLQSSIAEFRQATQLDPNFALAWAALARSYSFMASRTDPETQFDRHEELYRDARSAAEQALQISPDLPEAHDSLAAILLLHDWKFSEAIHEERAAIQLQPGNAANHSTLGWALSLTGHSAEAFHEFDLARSIDPYNTKIYLNESYADFASNNCSRILNMATKVQADMPGSAIGLLAAARGLWYCGRQQDALAAWRNAAVLSHDDLWVAREDQGLKAFRSGGEKAYALTRVAAAEQDDLAHRTNRYNEEEWDAIAGRTQKATTLMQKRFADHDSQFLVDCILPSLASVRKDPKIQDLIQQLHR